MGVFVFAAADFNLVIIGAYVVKVLIEIVFNVDACRQFIYKVVFGSPIRLGI